jgi:hypothetical protein
MDCSMGGRAAYAAYELVCVATGVPLYSTYATRDEIIQANRNLRNRNVPSRFYPRGTFAMPNLHTPASPLRAA